MVFISCCCSNKNIFLPEKFKALQNQLNISIEESKEKYYTKLSSRLADPVASPKKGNNYRKESNQSLKNYRPISLLPICSKSFDRLIYNEIFTFLLRTIWLLQINQDLDLVTLVLTNYLLLPTKFTNRLMKGLKLEGFS